MRKNASKHDIARQTVILFFSKRIIL